MIELQVTGMKCQHCVNAVRKALSATPGVTRVLSIDLDSGRTRIEGEATGETLIAAIRQAGYEATAP